MLTGQVQLPDRLQLSGGQIDAHGGRHLGNGHLQLSAHTVTGGGGDRGGQIRLSSSSSSTLIGRGNVWGGLSAGEPERSGSIPSSVLNRLNPSSHPVLSSVSHRPCPTIPSSLPVSSRLPTLIQSLPVRDGDAMEEVSQQASLPPTEAPIPPLPLPRAAPSPQCPGSSSGHAAPIRSAAGGRAAPATA